MTPGYCKICEQELNACSIIGHHTAWCSRCQKVVDVSCVPSWFAGVLCVLIANVLALRII